MEHMSTHYRIERTHLALLALVLAVFVWSGIRPREFHTWILEVAPVVLFLVVLLPTYHRFRLTTLLYVCIAIHSIILMIGGHYTYAEVPLFNWLRDMGVFARNNYDKIGHFAQGFFPALYAREVLLRLTSLRPGGWLSFLCIAVVGLVTSVYEIIEWLVAVAIGSAGDSFLGTQGYIWDTQSDMLLALFGAVLALLCLSRMHDRTLPIRTGVSL